MAARSVGAGGSDGNGKRRGSPLPTNNKAGDEQRETQRVLLIEDSPVDRRLILEYIDDPNIDISSVGRLADAIKVIAQGPPWDAVLLDLNLPDSSGIKTVERMVESAPQLAIIVLTGAGEDDGVAALRLGAQDYLDKDELSPQSLRRALRYSMERRRLLTELEDRRSHQKELSETLGRMDRLAAIGTLAASIGHEVNNPATWLQGNLELAIERLDELPDLPKAVRSELRQLLQDCLGGAIRIGDIVRRLKSFALTSDDPAEPVDVAQAIDDALSLVDNRLKHHATAHVVHETTRPASARRTQLVQVLVNLLTNAVDAIPAGNPSSHRIELVTSLSDNHIVITMKDTGRALAGSGTRLFDPLQGGGAGSAGLRLAISQRIAITLGGRVDFRREDDCNVYRLKLPSAEVAPPKEKRPRRPTPAPEATRRGRVLVVDDEPLVCRLTERILGRDYDVETAANGAEALKLLDANPDYDVVLCDLMMPTMTGMQLFEQVRTRWPDIRDRFVFLTGGAFSEEASQFTETVANRVLNKPISMNQLRAVVAEVVDTRDEAPAPETE